MVCTLLILQYAALNYYNFIRHFSTCSLYQKHRYKGKKMLEKQRLILNYLFVLL